ncbi:MAG: arylsulfotransferase family protein [Actinomycetota bacterium]|nr:arylsulfotransferase family protein [Actinomycetota bacterium]
MHHRKRLAVLSLLASIGAGALAPSPASSAPVTISPLPGTPTALAQTQISFLGAKTLGSITVVGSSSGRHRGRVRFYASAVGASFLPSTPFTPGERVTVRARVTSAKGKRVSISSSFTIAQPGVVVEKAFPITPGTPADVQSFRSQPQLHPPAVTVHQAAGPGSAHGYIFASPFVGPGQYGPMIFDNAGNLVWFRQTGPGEDAADFQTQTYRGESDLTWWQGRTIQYGYGMGVGVIADAGYHTVATVKTGNGLQADEHEFLVTPQGTAYMLAYSPVVTSLLAGGGPASGVALDGVIQQIDIRTGLVMWEWHSLGHVDMSESFSRVPTAAGAPFDYFHINSLTTDRHGNLLISARNTWALYDISARTGAVMWRLGGKKSTFALGAGVQFADQHNALWLPNGEISLFDDEGAPPVKPPSRGELIKLDLKAKTATLAGQLVRSPAPLSTASQGNLQSLPGGGWMIGWGGLPNFTEFNAQGQVIYDAQLPAGEFSYRVYRESWSGQPDEPPALVAKTSGTTSGVYASWNGATTVASWQLLTGSSSAHMTAVSTTPKSGFETVIPAPPAAFYEVRALGASGKVLGTSAAVVPTPG